MRTISEILAVGAADAPAILAPQLDPLTYAELRSVTAELAGQLGSLGVSSSDRVAIVLPNGPAMALAFLAVARCATVAPLNPEYREEEFRFYLKDLGVKALITFPDDAGAAHAAAPDGTLHLALEGTPSTLRLGHDGAFSEAAPPTSAGPDDLAMVLHTSGTTARPKIVPLTQRNLATSAGNIARSLVLTDADRCLNPMPLFHIHGLMAGLLAPLAVGGSVICTPGFEVFRFFDWMDELEPTWYTAVPTMHHLILARARRHAAVIARNPLRFLRSSSASLPPDVMTELEGVFGAPMIEAYGMTEASHQMASNPLPPAERKAGSVGRGTIDVAIMNDAGELLPTGERGEVVIKGPSVVAAYENNPEANAKAFTHGWFRTGDQGYVDAGGYLFLTGRLKEIINRGGEKISPREVDEVLLRHPEIDEAVAFAVPHDKLGEDIAAAVVLAEGATAREGDLRSFAAERLADFKVPRTFVILEQIPKGPTGKVQRVGLAKQLGLVR
ncbi:MAG: acyl--CoA ligase [Gemmatimonadetes bacterium]|nr:acyl--CoA ligase [Gemmatimonadota bacterium]